LADGFDALVPALAFFADDFGAALLGELDAAAFWPVPPLAEWRAGDPDFAGAAAEVLLRAVDFDAIGPV
jgi:hypothetical protein